MKKAFLVMVGVLFCGFVFADILTDKQKVLTLSATSATPLFATETYANEYTISAGANNTGTVYVGTSAVNSTQYGTYLNAQDTESKQTVKGNAYALHSVYVYGTVANDTVAVKYN